MRTSHYLNLVIMAALHFAAMYVLMYAMVNTYANVFPNLNQAYMAGTMTAPMIVLELLLMRSMYDSMTLNLLFVAGSVVILVGSILLIRNQVAISDKEFLRSMIPHHAAAILMCERASIQDNEVKELCRSIISNQQSEIDQMKAKLGQLER